MNRRRPGPGRKLLGAALFVSACSSSEQPCAVKSPNDAGMRCACLDEYDPMRDALVKKPYCDPDIGNPCTIGCFNSKLADGGREYDTAGNPVCFC